MPAIRYYEVEQTRTVKVAANSAAQAVLIANKVFSQASPEEVLIPAEEIPGLPVGKIEVSRIDVNLER